MLEAQQGAAEERPAARALQPEGAGAPIFFSLSFWTSREVAVSSHVALSANPEEAMCCGRE